MRVSTACYPAGIFGGRNRSVEIKELPGRDMGLTHLRLTPNRESNARRLGERLKGLLFANVQARYKPSSLANLGGSEPWMKGAPLWWSYGKPEGPVTTRTLPAGHPLLE